MNLKRLCCLIFFFALVLAKESLSFANNSNLRNDDFFCDNDGCNTLNSMLLSNEEGKGSLFENNNSSLFNKANKNHATPQDNPLQQSLTKKELPKENWLVNTFKNIKNPFELNDTTGFYFFAGYVHNIDLVPSFTYNSTTTSDSKYFKKNVDMGYNIALGARYYGGNFLFALEAYYLDQKHDYLYTLVNRLQINNNGTLQPKDTIQAFRASVDRIYGLAAHIGGGFARLNFYGIIGMAVGDISISTMNGDYSSLNESFKRTSIGITYGAGADFFITDNLFFSVRYQEYRFDYDVTTTKLLNASGNAALSISNDITLKHLSIGGGIKFF
ncbi:MAG: hypothetical protein RL208_579 [Pseudomonadota bacterium]|jgi:opacity protein-like surface antigen